MNQTDELFEPVGRFATKATLGTWRVTNRWKPGRTGTASKGVGVECVETGDVGFCKKINVAREKICSDLAREVGVRVPEARLGNLEGHNEIAVVSLADGIDLSALREGNSSLYGSPVIQEAIRAASGLLPFYVWAEITDFKDEHLLIADERGGYSVAAIDFATSLQWGDPQEPVQFLGAHPALLLRPDVQVIEMAVQRIEALANGRIEEIVNSIPDLVLPIGEKERVIKGLKFRRPKVREVMREKSWLL